MLSYEQELSRLGAPASVIARERREVFSVHPEVRALAWGGAMLIAAGVSALVAKNLERIGPLALTIAIGVAAAGCYSYGFFGRRGLIRDYLIVLGALLISVDVAYAESQFHLLDSGWPRHILILAVLHAIAAYVFESKAVLALSIAALASWLGVEKNVFDGTSETGWRALLACGAVSVWRAAHRSPRDFIPLFEHYAANLALAGTLLLTISHQYRWIGLALLLIGAAAVTWLGFRRDSEPFVIYAYAYAVIAIDIVICDSFLHDGVLISLYLIVSSVAAIVGLFVLHGRLRRQLE